ncbi:MAG: hypothetical protein VKK98_02950 [Cyanobacteriota bacterium]|nr:hypothetical protein [Cyanobacteriota bacterium]
MDLSLQRGAAGLASALLLIGTTAGPSLAQERGYGQTVGGYPQQDREFGNGSEAGTSIFNTANPMDLMNVLRRATAMDDATPPGDAIDAALNDYQQQGAGSAGINRVP